MKAILCPRYGIPEKVLKIMEIPAPSPKSNEVLIRVMSTAINDYDWSMVRGKPFLYRLIFGLFKPRNPIPGMELSGIIEEVGTGVTELSAGEAVYGDISDFGFGTFAGYICIDAKAVVKKPQALSFEEAAAIPHASLLALQAIDMFGPLTANTRVLINGAGGGVGTMGFYILKKSGCIIDGVDGDAKLEMLSQLGFDKVIDYRRTDFTSAGRQYDFILDCKTDKSPFAYLKALRPGGKYITVGGSLSKIFQVLFWGIWIRSFTSKRVLILSLKPNRGLGEIQNLFAQGKIKCTLDGPYRFEDIPRLIQYFGDGRHLGKVVVNVD